MHTNNIRWNRFFSFIILFVFAKARHVTRDYSSPSPPLGERVGVRGITQIISALSDLVMTAHFFYLAQLGCELTPPPSDRAQSLTCRVGTSITARCRFPCEPRTKTTVREFAAQLASSPEVNGVAWPPVAGTMQISKPMLFCEENTIHLLSGDQSGSEGLDTPDVGTRCAAPPSGDIFHKARRSLVFAA